MSAMGESDNDFSTSKDCPLIERSIRKGFNSSPVRELRSRLSSNFFASAK